MAEIEMPQLGETVTEGTIIRWFKQVGDTIEVDELLFEVSTDKVDSEVPSPMGGVLTEIRVPEGETVDVGTVLAVIGDGSDAPAPEAEAPAEEAPAAEAPAEAEPSAEPQPSEPAPREPAPVGDGGGDGGGGDGLLLSPMVRRLIREHDLDPDQIEGTGVGGRITRNDVLALIDQRSTGDSGAAAPERAAPEQPAPEQPAPERPAPAKQSAPTPQQAPSPPERVAAAAAPATAAGPSEWTAFSNIRRRTAEHMVMSLATSAHALTVTEIDYEGVDRVRRAEKDGFRADEGFSLTYLPFIARAVIDALGDWPRLNASVEGDGLRIFRDVNLGIAVDLDLEGLIVPVVRQADGRRLRALAREVNDLAARARDRSLGVDDITGGTFTISNNGSFGTYTTAAIINQPQVAVLSTDGISRRPVVVTDDHGNESIAIHSVGNLAMAWDHRAFDGSYAGGFLRQVKETIETRDWSTEI